MNREKLRIIKWVIGLTITTVVSTVFYARPLKMDEVQNVQDNLISASGILAGILIVFLSAKLFQIAEDNNKSKELLNELSDKLTQYRKILYRILRSHEIWTNKRDVEKFKKEEFNATYYTLHADDIESKDIRRKYWLDAIDKPLSYTTIDLYLAMEEITGKSDETSYWAYDDTTYYEYALEYLKRIENPANQIWYYLDGRYAKHTIGEINEDGFATIELIDKNMNTLITSISPEFKSREFDRVLVAEISTFFYEKVIPEMIRIMVRRSKPLTKSVLGLLASLIIVLVAGVVMPLIFQLLDLGVSERIFTAIFVMTVIVSLSTFLLDLVGLTIDDGNSSILEKDRVKYGIEKAQPQKNKSTKI